MSAAEVVLGLFPEGMTHTDLAQRLTECGLRTNKMTVGRWLSGRTDPGPAVWDRISSVLGLDEKSHGRVMLAWAESGRLSERKPRTSLGRVLCVCAHGRPGRAIAGDMASAGYTVSRSTVNRWISGEIVVPKPMLLPLLSAMGADEENVRAAILLRFKEE